MSDPAKPFVSRAGLKLEHAMQTFGLDAAGKVCADLGSNTGGFVDCLLRRGAARVYAVDTGYGVLEWKLRNDPRVVVMERTNAMHVVLPEKVQIVTIDVAWTRQQRILPAAARILVVRIDHTIRNANFLPLRRLLNKAVVGKRIVHHPFFGQTHLVTIALARHGNLGQTDIRAAAGQ